MKNNLKKMAKTITLSLVLGTALTATSSVWAAIGNGAGIASVVMNVNDVNQNTAVGNASMAWGFKSEATGHYSTAGGNKSKALGSNSVALGGYAEASAENSVAIGYYAVTGLGANEAANGKTVVANEFAVGGGNDGTNVYYSKITGVADGVNDHDAATYGQLTSMGQELNSQIDRMGTRIDKVGAGAAALAALHPLDFDPDNKLSFSVGVGNYRSENAAALGVFYRPVDRVMFSMGATMGNDNNMVNAGVTFALDRKLKFANGLGSAPLGKASRETLVSEVQLLNAENTKLNNKVKDLDDKVAKLMKVIEELKKK